MSIGSISAPLSAVSRATSAAAIFYTVIDAPKAKTGALRDPDVSVKEDIVLNRVNFTYISRPDQRVLKNVTLTFPAGQTTAIVGPSGSGKSTIVALLQRWYELGVGVEESSVVSELFNCCHAAGSKD